MGDHISSVPGLIEDLACIISKNSATSSEPMLCDAICWVLDRLFDLHESHPKSRMDSSQSLKADEPSK
jgi:hypothetical protein